MALDELCHINAAYISIMLINILHIQQKTVSNSSDPTDRRTSPETVIKIVIKLVHIRD